MSNEGSGMAEAAGTTTDLATPPPGGSVEVEREDGAMVVYATTWTHLCLERRGRVGDGEVDVQAPRRVTGMVELYPLRETTGRSDRWLARFDRPGKLLGVGGPVGEAEGWDGLVEEAQRMRQVRQQLRLGAEGDHMGPMVVLMRAGPGVAVKELWWRTAHAEEWEMRRVILSWS